MNLMTPYFFSASISQSINAWVLSPDFYVKIGLTTSGSTGVLAESSGSGWQYSSSYTAATLTYTITQTGVYELDITSTGSLESGSFFLYLTAGTSASLATSNSYNASTFTNKLIYSPVNNKLFVCNTNIAPAACNVSVVNPNTMTNIYSYNYDANTAMIDAAYNSASNTVWVWYSSGSEEHFDVFYGDGSSISSSLTFSIDWGSGGSFGPVGLMAYDSTNNNILLVPTWLVGPHYLSHSIYDCDNYNVASEVLPPHSANRYPVYVPSNDSYYVFQSFDSTNPTIKINASTYVESTVANMTGSGIGTYSPEIDRLFFSNPGQDGTVVYDPSTDDAVAQIAGVSQPQSVACDTCKDVIVISDGLLYGLCTVDFNYLPKNFFGYSAVGSIVYCAGTSTIVVSSYEGATISTLFAQGPTGSLAQPPLPPSPPATLTATQVGYNTMSLVSWSFAGTYAQELYRSGSDGNNWVTYSVDANVRHYYDSASIEVTTSYWYKTRGLWSPLEGYSNTDSVFILEEVPVVAGCASPPFQAVAYSSSVSSATPIMVAFESPGSGSVAAWGRIMGVTVDARLFINKPDGTNALTDDDNGWNNPYADYNSAGFVELDQVGTYGITMSAWPSDADAGQLIISPGFESGSIFSQYSSDYLTYVSSSNCVCAGIESSGDIGFGDVITFYDFGQKSVIASYDHTVYTFNAGVHFSPAQDSVFAWVETASVQSIVEFDNTGGIVATYDISSDVNYTRGVSCYDKVNDRIFLVEYQKETTPASYSIWDCATRAIIQSGHLPGVDYVYACAYVDVNNRYYVSQYNNSMSYVDADTYATGVTTANASNKIQYISESQVIMTIPTGFQGMRFIDPVGDTVVYTDTSLQNLASSHFYDAIYDPCSDVIVASVTIGFNQSLICYNKTTFSGSNQIGYLDDDIYGLCFATSGSRVYTTTYDFPNTKIWSTRVSIPSGYIMV